MNKLLKIKFVQFCLYSIVIITIKTLVSKKKQEPINWKQISKQIFMTTLFLYVIDRVLPDIISKSVLNSMGYSLGTSIFNFLI